MAVRDDVGIGLVTGQRGDQRPAVAAAGEVGFDLRNCRLGERARDELLADLRADPPRVVSIQHGAYFRFVTGDDRDSAAALSTFPELATMLEDEYTYVGKASRLDLHVRK